jgi:hypothetical protein
LETQKRWPLGEAPPHRLQEPAQHDRSAESADKDGDRKLNSDEFKTFNEILKPGIATDEQGKPTVDYSERMDHDGDGLVSQDEMNTTGLEAGGPLRSEPEINAGLPSSQGKSVGDRSCYFARERSRQVLMAKGSDCFRSRSFPDFRSIYP